MLPRGRSRRARSHPRQTHSTHRAHSQYTQNDYVPTHHGHHAHTHHGQVNPLFKSPLSYKNKLLDLAIQVHVYREGEMAREQRGLYLYEQLPLSTSSVPYRMPAELADIYLSLQWVYFLARTFPTNSKIYRKVVSHKNEYLAEELWGALPQKDHYYVSRAAGVSWTEQATQLHDAWIRIRRRWDSEGHRKKLRTADGKPLTKAGYLAWRDQFQQMEMLCLKDANTALKLARKALKHYEEQEGHSEDDRKLRLRIELVRDQQRLLQARFQYLRRRYRLESNKAKKHKFLEKAISDVRSYQVLTHDVSAYPLEMPEDMRVFKKKHMTNTARTYAGPARSHVTTARPHEIHHTRR